MMIQRIPSVIAWLWMPIPWIWRGQWDWEAAKVCWGWAWRALVGTPTDDVLRAIVIDTLDRRYNLPIGSLQLALILDYGIRFPSRRAFRRRMARLERSGVVRSWEGSNGQRVYALPVEAGEQVKQ